MIQHQRIADPEETPAPKAEEPGQGEQLVVGPQEHQNNAAAAVGHQIQEAAEVEHQNQETHTTAALGGEGNCCTWVDSAPGTADSVFAGPGNSDEEQEQALAQAEIPCPHREEPRREPEQRHGRVPVPWEEQHPTPSEPPPRTKDSCPQLSATRSVEDGGGEGRSELQERNLKSRS